MNDLLKLAAADENLSRLSNANTADEILSALKEILAP